VAVHVHQDAGIRLAAPLGPVVDPSTVTCPISGSGIALTRRISVNRETTAPSTRASRGPCAAGQRERDPLQQPPQPCRAPLVPGGQPLHLLSERRDRAGRVVADEAADLQPGRRRDRR
jgi:hypothetical protein